MRCRSGRRRLLGAGRFWPSRVGLRGKRVARSLRGLGAKRLLAHLRTILYMRACVIARLADSNLSPRRIIITNPSIFANNPACRVGSDVFLRSKKRLTPPAAVASLGYLSLTVSRGRNQWYCPLSALFLRLPQMTRDDVGPNRCRQIFFKLFNRVPFNEKKNRHIDVPQMPKVCSGWLFGCGLFCCTAFWMLLRWFCRLVPILAVSRLECW